jgi:uncharacterized protein (TIGR03437 family)
VDAYNLVTGWLGAGSSARVSASVAVQTTASSIAATGSVTVTATVTSSGGVTPTGSGTFTAGSQQIGVAPLSGTGASASASITISATHLEVGANNIVAQYGGNFALGAASGTITVAVTAAASIAAPVIQKLANGASFGQTYAPGMVLTIFGSNLADATWIASSVPLPGHISGVTVTIGAVNAPLYYVSPGQLNVQIPYETPLNQASTLTVTNNGRTATSTITVAAAAPGVFTDAKGAIAGAATAARGAVVSLYLTGAGAVSPAISTGGAPASGTLASQLPAPVQKLSVSVGGVTGVIEFAGIPSTLVGVMQINLRIPATAPLGTQPVIVTIGGIASAPANITVTAQ